MQYTRFGNTGMEVSRLTLGCMDFPSKLGDEGSLKLIDSAMEAGINFLDTADTYAESEETLGRILGARREKLFLATKHHRWKFKGNSRQLLIQALESSLRKLKTDYVDLYQLHHPSKVTPMEETLSTLDLLVKQGKIRYIGVSNHYAWQMAAMLGVSALHNWEPLVSIQCRYNVLDRPVEIETVPFCRAFNIAMMTYSPMDWGALSGKYRRGEIPPPDTRLGSREAHYRDRLSDKAFDVLEPMEKIAAKYDIPMNQLAIAWLLAKPWVTTVILGGTKAEYYTSAYPAADIILDPEDVRTIDELSESFRYKPFVNQPVSDGPPVGRGWW